MLQTVSVFFNCRGQREVGKLAEEIQRSDTMPELAEANELISSKDGNGDGVMDSQANLRNADYSNFYTENIDLIDSLKEGVERDGGAIIYYDSVPQILYKVLPQLIFIKVKHLEMSAPFTRMQAYYNSREIHIGNMFNYLLKEMEYSKVPTFEEKILALIVITEGYAQPLEISKIEKNEEQFNKFPDTFNYKVYAKLNNMPNEYLIAYHKDQFEVIVKLGDDYKGLRPLLIKN